MLLGSSFQLVVPPLERASPASSPIASLPTPYPDRPTPEALAQANRPHEFRGILPCRLVGRPTQRLMKAPTERKSDEAEQSKQSGPSELP